MSSFRRERADGRIGVRVGHCRGGQTGCTIKLSCVLELEMSCDADELIQPGVEGMTATALQKGKVCFPSGCNLVESFSLSDWQLNSCIR